MLADDSISDFSDGDMNLGNRDREVTNTATHRSIADDCEATSRFRILDEADLVKTQTECTPADRHHHPMPLHP